MTCHVSDTCTQIKCCVNVEAIDRTFSIVVDIDSCAFVLRFLIEKLEYITPLLGYSWGKEESIWMNGIVKLE